MGNGGTAVRLAPILPSGWDDVRVENIQTRRGTYEARITQQGDSLRITLNKMTLGIESGNLEQVLLEPAFPADAACERVLVNDGLVISDTSFVGDVQRVRVQLNNPQPRMEALFVCSGGTHVLAPQQELVQGMTNEGLRILQARATEDNVDLIVEGLGGRQYPVEVHTESRFVGGPGVSVRQEDGQTIFRLAFEGEEDRYVRRQIRVVKL